MQKYVDYETQLLKWNKILLVFDFWFDCTLITKIPIKSSIMSSKEQKIKKENRWDDKAKSIHLNQLR